MSDLKEYVRVRMSAAALSELHACEYGSYEDHIERLSDGGVRRLAPYNQTRKDGSFFLHICEIIEREIHKTVVILKWQQEIDEFFVQSVTGTFGLDHAKVVYRIYDQLYPLISDELRNDPCCPKRGSIGY